MIVVHGWWSLPAAPADGGRLVLWGEDALAPASGQHQAGRRPKVRNHPFAASAEALSAAIGLPELLAAAGSGAGLIGDATADLELPGFANAPAASPELLDLRSITRAVPADGESARLYPGVRWRVPVVTVEAEAAELVLWELCRRSEFALELENPDVPLLPDDVQPDEPQPDQIRSSESDETRPDDDQWDNDPLRAGLVHIGSDLRQLFGIAGFAADLVRRGRVLPVALPAGADEPGQGVARWRPVLTGVDAEWFRAAVAALPPSYRAAFQELDQPAEVLAGVSAAAAVDDLADAAVRARAGILPRIRTGASAPTGLAGWRRALRGPTPLFTTTPAKLAELAGALATWQKEAAGGGSVRACFRLVEPTDDDEESVLQRWEAPVRTPEERARWHLEFGLQVADEPSLVAWAGQIWAPGQTPAAIERHVEQPQEALLGELGRALRLYPMLGVALAGARPTELSLDTMGAHDFLAEAAGLLVGAGFGVFLPGWWTKPQSRLGVRLRAGTPTQPGRVEGTPAFGQGELVEFDWRLSVGDQTLTEDEVEHLIEARQSLVRLRGEWMQVNPERLRKAREFLRRNNSRKDMTVGDVLRVLGSVDEAPGGLPVTGVDAEGWLGDLLATDADQRLTPVPIPAAFTGTLRPYQERGLAWLSFLDSAGLGGVLADDMGLGKTVQLLALIARDLDDAAGDGPDAPPRPPTLLVCPMSLVGNWQREAARFTPQLRVHVHHGSERPRGEEFEKAVAASDLVVTTYALLARDAVALRAMTWRRVVLDEAQAVKNAATQAAIAARSLRSGRRIAVTGTPVENRLADLWSLMEFANPKLLGDAAEFKKRFALPIERLGDQDASARLRSLTQPFVLRRLKTDRSIITDLPAKLEMEVVCTLTSEQAALYQSVVTDMLERIEQTDGMERRGLVLATMTKLKQVCNHPAQFLRDGSRIAGRSGKLARLEETLEEVLAAGEKALLFTQYAEFGELMRTHLTSRFGREVLFLHGGTSKAQRDEMVARFQDERPGHAGPPLFVLSLKAGGTGLTLTAANHVVHVDRWWNPAVEDQATDRAFRIGQSRAVQVRKFVTAGTLEEKIATMITDKRGLAASVVGTGEGWLTELDTAQLRDLFTLEAGSVMS